MNTRAKEMGQSAQESMDNTNTKVKEILDVLNALIGLTTDFRIRETEISTSIMQAKVDAPLVIIEKR